jgi:hypothetical protein
MRDFWLQEYEKWKKEQKKEEKVPETKQEEWRFQWGDVVPKQGYNSFSEYIRDAACLVGDNETKPLSEILEEDGQFRYYFGIKQLI